MFTTDNRATRRVTMVALTGTTALAIVGASVLSASAANATTYSCLTTNGSTMLVDGSSAGSGLLNLGSTSGLLGIAVGANGLQVGLLNCVAVVSVGGAGATAVATLVPSTPATTVPTVPVITPTTPGSTTPTTTPTTPGTTPGSTTPATTTPASTELASVKLTTSATTVYPTKDGYKDKVTFSVKGLTSSATGVKITGKAVLRKGTKVVKTWKITSSTSKLTWNGRIGTKVKAGTYKLTVTAWSADGVKKTSTMKVTVSSKHLVTKTVAVKSKNIANVNTAVTPAKVLKALKLGKVTVRIRTVAHVTGTAKLVFKGNGSQSVVALHDGTHTNKAVAVPKGLKQVSIVHKWKKGAATLTSLHAIYTYKKLV